MGRLIRTVLVLAIVLIVGAYFLGYLPQTAALFGSTQAPATVKQPDVEASKDAPSKSQPPSGDLKDRAQQAARQMDATLADTTLTTKIKAKIALDDTVKSANVSIHTKAGVVTIAGSVNSPAMQQRILQLARETAGVKTVVNETTVASKS